MGRIKLAHGSGGIEMGDILNKLIFSRVADEFKRIRGGLGIDNPDDAAAIPVGDKYIVISTDSYTVNPPFFPESNIGGLAASGTINDVLMAGARPIAALDSIIVEEGFSMDDLGLIIDTMIKVFTDNNVALIGGDFKVMPRNSIDRIVINTVGVGLAEKLIVDKNIRVGDKILVTGPIGEHGAVILALQEGIKPDEVAIKSDVKPLTGLMVKLFEYIDYIHAARDPTRGGLSMLLNDWARISGKLIYIDESKIPIRDEVKSYSNLLGIDPYSLASEGVAVLSIDPGIADEIIDLLHGLGYSDVSLIGEVRSGEKMPGRVVIRTTIGGLRFLEPPTGELVPRIC